MKKIIIIAGARPNFMKIAPIIHEIKKQKKKGSEIDYSLVHTGQHYDHNMSGSFFKELNIPSPDVNLMCGGGGQSEQTANIMVAFEKFLKENSKPSLVLVVGDVNSTMACAIVAQKLNIKVAHVEAGIRSNDWSMPEEINRIVTDSISNYFFTTTIGASNQLKANGVAEKNIHFVGNTMIDTLLKNKPNFKKPQIWDKLNLKRGNYIVITLHRPANVDEQTILKLSLEQIIENSEDIPLIFPMHPRTYGVFKKMNISNPRLHVLPPLSYLEFNYLVRYSKAVITDSGGITEETTVLKVPCLTLRDNTERPETINLGTNELVGTNPKSIAPVLNKLMNGNWKKGSIPELWDGKAAKRIVISLMEILNKTD